jgi:ferredoxin
MKLTVDTTKCSGIGLCEMAAPAVYEVGDDGQSHIIEAQPAAHELPNVQDAIAGCPTGALSLQP